MDPTRFTRAKSFIESSGCKLLIEEGHSETCYSFCIPKQCPSMQALLCPSSGESSTQTAILVSMDELSDHLL
jgi:hypothetical protein